jgi:hypothetical protein
MRFGFHALAGLLQDVPYAGPDNWLVLDHRQCGRWCPS